MEEQQHHHQEPAHAEEEQQQQRRQEELVVAGGALPPQQQQQVLVQQQQKEEPVFSAEDLHGNDTRILALLNEEGSNYSFKGIQRRLGIHQQSLARALHRLTDMGLVERSSIGYHLSRVGANAATAGPAAKEAQGAKGSKREYIQLLQTHIPVSVRPAEVARPLVGKWFKNLRWVGLIESGTGFTLQWAGQGDGGSSDSSFQINLRMISDYVIVETNASGEREKLQAMAGSYAIFEQITKVLQDRLSSTAAGPAANTNAYVFGRQHALAAAANN